MSDKFRKIYPWVVVALLWVVAFLNYMDRQMLSTMQDAMKMDIAELRQAQNFGRLMAIFMWIYAFVSPFAGAVADRLSRKWLVVGSLGVWSAVTLAMGHCTTFSQLYWLRAVMGVSEALYIPSSLSLIAEYHTGKSRGLAIGIHTTGLYFGQAVGGFGASLSTALSWQQTFHWFGIIGVLYAVVLVFLLKDIRRETAVTLKAPAQKIPLGRSFAMIFSNVAFWTIIFYFASASIPGWGAKNWLPTLFHDRLDVPMDQAGPVSTITIAIASFIGVMTGGPLSDRWVKRNVRGRVYTSAIGLGLMVPALVLLGLGKGYFALILAGVIFGIGYGMFDTNNMPIVCQFIPTRLRATAYGIINMVGVLMGAFCTEVLGRMKDSGNLGLAFAIFGGVALLAVASQLLFLKPVTDNME